MIETVVQKMSSVYDQKGGPIEGCVLRVMPSIEDVKSGVILCLIHEAIKL
jgi:hypothetical protein